MQRKLTHIFDWLPIAALLLGSPAYAQTNNADPQMAETPQEATQEGIAYQADMPPMQLIRAMFLDLQASSEAGQPVARADSTFETGERIAIYAKFANVGRVHPGALDGLMSIDTDVRITDTSGTIIVDQRAQGPQLESVPYPYQSPIPAAYFESFKLNLMALPIAGDFTISLTFHDRTRPESETKPVEVVLQATVE